jgi:hypothetical protein
VVSGHWQQNREKSVTIDRNIKTATKIDYGQGRKVNSTQMSEKKYLANTFLRLIPNF